MLSEERAYKPLPKFPAILRDVSALFTTEVRVSHVLSLIDTSDIKYVEDVDLMDYFEDEKALGAGKRSMTFRLVFRSGEKTLTDAEVDGEMQKVVKLFEQKLKAEIR
jgi:phenylalanyl-tRNA synthetase beta chain